MTQKPGASGAPAFVTGGGGTEFEDDVGTYLVSAMLAGDTPLAPIGQLARIAFQQKVPPSPLDDIVVSDALDSGARWFASVKAFDVLGNGLAEFVGAAWQQLLADDFDLRRDFVGFVGTPPPAARWQSLEKLVDTARHDDPERLAARIETPGVFNEHDRALWSALACPPQLATAAEVDLQASPALLLQRLVALVLDSRSPTSQGKAQAVSWCRAALRTGHAGQADALRAAVFELVSKVRPLGGSIDCRSLGRALQDFVLAERPDTAPDWAILDRFSEERLAAIRDTLANGLRLPRAQASQALAPASDAAFWHLTGPSGCGKTALAKQWASEGSGRTLWLSAADLEQGLLSLSRQLGLRLPLTEVLTLAGNDLRIVVDGLDRSYGENPFAATAAIARTATASSGRASLLVTTQTYQLERVAQTLARLGAPAHQTAIMGDLDDEDLELALQQRPALHRLRFQGRLQDVLRRPKVLEVVFEAIDHVDNETLAAVSDEADVADLWWRHLARGATDSAARSELLLRLSSYLADSQSAQLAAGQLHEAALDSYAAQIDELRREEILDASLDDYAFAHDLFGDWSRYRSFGSWSSAQAKIVECAGSPTWHLAIRLFALATLREHGAQEWARQQEILRQAGQHTAADLFLDALLFAGDTAAQLESLWPSLMADHGQLFRRLLNRFALVATITHPQADLLATGADAEFAAHLVVAWRLPIWILWPPVIGVVANHAAQAVEAAPVQVASMVDRWLRAAPPDSPGTEEAASIGVAIAEFLARSRNEGIYLEEDENQKLWRAFLAAGSMRPDEISQAAVAILTADAEPDTDL